MTVEEYLKLPYAVEIRWDAADQIFVARVSEIPECTGHGQSRPEALNMVFDNLRDWVEDALESGETIPVPIPIEDLPSGKWVQRVPRSMHSELVKLAAQDDVSLNQFVVSVLAREIGFRSGVRQSRFAEASPSSDPSTALWNFLTSEIAISRKWIIHDPLSEGFPNLPFLQQLAEKLPPHIEIEDRGNKTHAKKDHKIWEN